VGLIIATDKVERIVPPKKGEKHVMRVVREILFFRPTRRGTDIVQALDFAKRGMSKMELAWMRAYLQPLMQSGKIDVEEEFYQSCFHITVYKSYAPPATPESPVVHGSLLAERVK